jgi:prophage regulatory protein
MNTTQHEHAPAYWNKRVLTLEELSQYTGYSRRYLQNMVQRCEIPFSRPNGKSLFFDREKIEAWLLRNSVKSNGEVEQKAANYLHKKK